MPAATKAAEFRTHTDSIRPPSSPPHPTPSAGPAPLASDVRRRPREPRLPSGGPVASEVAPPARADSTRNQNESELTASPSAVVEMASQAW